MMKRFVWFSIMLLSSAANAAELVTFESGTSAKASEVNGNFEALNTDVQANTTAISNISLTAGAIGATGATGSAGADGAQGLQGPAGADGAQGLQGPAGADGAQGIQGVQGPAGADGAAGGATGPAGPTGADGVAGADGAQGIQGIQGPAGPTGADGPQGVQGIAGVDGVDGADGAQGPAGPAGPAGAGGSATAVVDVDCGTGGSIQTAIDSATAGIVTINVTGTCTEDLVISRSNLIIDGGVSGSTLITTSSPGIQVFGASNIEISNLTVTAGANQALALDDAQVSLRDTDISSVGITGGDIASYVAFIDHSKLYMTGSTIAHTSAPDDSGGLLVINNSTLVLDDGNTISVAGAGGTETTALDVLQSSAVTRGFTPGATDTISGNDIGLLLEGASSGFLGTGITITGIAEVIGGSYMLVEEMTLTGDLEVSLNSSFYAEADNPCSGTCDINIIGDVELYSGGQLEMEGVDVSGTITVSHSTSVDIYKSELTNIDADGRVSVDGGAIDGTIECRNGGASETVRLSANGATTTVVGLNVVGGSGPSCVNNNGPVDFSI